MLKFSKRKHEKKEKTKKKSSKQTKELASAEKAFPKLCPSGDFDLKKLLECQGCNLKPKESTNRSSRLSISLKEMLKSPLALAYFMEFLNTKRLKHLVDFWIAVEAFGVAAGERNSLKNNQNDINGSHGTVNQNHTFCGENKGAVANNVDLLGNNELNLRNSNCSDCERNQEKADVSTRLKTSDSGPTMTSSAEYPAFASLNGFCERDKEIEPQHGFDNWHEYSDTTSSVLPNDETKHHNLTDDWQPFVSHEDVEDGKKESLVVDRKNSYVARRIMSKQARCRTGSAVIDAVGIYARYMSLDADEPIDIPSDMRNELEARICEDKQIVSPECFSQAQQFVFTKLETLHEEFLESTFGNKYKLFILRDSKLKLEDILYHDHSLFYFMEYLDQESFKEVIEFWLMAENFEQGIIKKLNNGTYDLNEAVEDAMSIYDKYFSMRAKHQMIEDDKLRIVIENNICREDGPQSNCFCIPVAYAWTALKEIFYPRFLKSETFVQLLDSFFKNSVDSPKNDDVLSTASSDSRSETQEFLSSAASFSDFLDKDSEDLWYRPDAGRLAMGYVNEYGNFITELESPEWEEDKGKHASVSKLGKAMKNLLHKESDEEKERLAWEKARSIIEDIQRQSK